MKNKISYLLLTSFLLGYFINDVVSTKQIKLISNANAKIAGMNYSALMNDYDFKKAVMTIAEDECRTDIDPKTFTTWFYCNENSKHNPESQGYKRNYDR
jgi:hypothetical protein